MKMSYPATVAVTRYYCTYIEAEEDASEKEIKDQIRKQILELQEDALALDLDFDIEEQDLGGISIDFDGAVSVE